MNIDDRLHELLVAIKYDGKNNISRNLDDDIRRIKTILQSPIPDDWRPTTELEKLEMKRSFIHLANRLKCRYVDSGDWVQICIRPMTMIKKGTDDEHTAEPSQAADTTR